MVSFVQQGIWPVVCHVISPEVSHLCAQWEEFTELMLSGTEDICR